MMALLRSRRTMFILVGLVVVGMVVSAAVGLFNAIGTAPTAAPQQQPQDQGQQDGGQGTGPTPDAPPDVDVLGQAPSGLSYFSDAEADVYCDQMSCVRLVMVLTEGGEPPEDSQTAIDSVYGVLQERGWENKEAQGAPEGQLFFSDGDHLVTDSSSYEDPEAPAVLMLGEATGPTAP